MECWDGLDLILTLWAPLVAAGSIVGAWALLTPRVLTQALDAPVRRRLEPASTTTLRALLELAEEQGRAWQVQDPTRSPARAAREHDALRLTTLVAISLVRDWTARLDRNRLGPHTAPVIDAIRSRTGEALVLLSSRPAVDEPDHQLPQRLQILLAQLAADLRRFQLAVRPAGLDPYR